jgi:Fic family protein
VVKRRWPSNLSTGLSRRDRRGCEYEAYVPDLLTDRRLRLDADTAADVSDAERAVARFSAASTALSESEAITRLLLRAEAVASSKIEGLEVGARRLLKAEAARSIGGDAGAADVTALEVLNNIEAMRWAVDTLGAADSISVEGILGVHRRLLEGTRNEEHAGKIRSRQNWIGGSEFNPCSAAFVPPPEGRVEELLDDLVAFCNTDSLPAVAQAAVAHAHFETIHPFADGNGRTGRVLIHVILRRRGLVTTELPPVSLVLASWAKDYVEGLTATRYRGHVSSQAAHDGLNRWIGLFAAATRRAVADAEAYKRRVAQVQRVWRARLGKVRQNSAVDLLIDVLPSAPIITVRSGASLVGRSEQAINEAIPRLVHARVLTQTTVGRRNRAFEAKEVIAALTDLERQLASPDADSRLVPD